MGTLRPDGYRPGGALSTCRRAVARQVAGPGRHLLSSRASVAAAPAALAEGFSQAMAMLVETYAGKRLRPDDAVGQPVSTDLYPGHREVRWEVPGSCPAGVRANPDCDTVASIT